MPHDAIETYVMTLHHGGVPPELHLICMPAAQLHATLRSVPNTDLLKALERSTVIHAAGGRPVSVFLRCGPEPDGHHPETGMEALKAASCLPLRYIAESADAGSAEDLSTAPLVFSYQTVMLRAVRQHLKP